MLLDAHVWGDSSEVLLKLLHEFYRGVLNMIAKSHLYIAHWQVLLRTVSSITFSSDKRVKP